jgi:hypothetical protein
MSSDLVVKEKDSLSINIGSALNEAIFFIPHSFTPKHWKHCGKLVPGNSACTVTCKAQHWEGGFCELLAYKMVLNE